jgi:Na+/proline symporter
VIGISLGFNDPAVAQYVGFGLHLLTGTVAGNIFGQASTYWRWIAPYDYHHGIITGLIVGVALWAILFVPVTTFGDISGHFQSLYPIIIGGSLVFHIIYGSLLGFIAGRMEELGSFLKE